jgi:isoleucyl-tRNA synthetase
MSVDKLSAYQTLYTCLETVAKLMAPIAPYYADRLYTDLTAATDRADAESVHLATFPISNESMIDASLEYRMKLAQQITSMVLSLRKKEKIIVRQPLQSISIPVGDAERQNGIEAVKQLILDEVNVKELNFVEGNGMLVKKVKCNFRTMGKKFGKLMKSVASAVETLSQEQIASLESNEWLDVTIDNGEMVRIESVDVEIFSEDIPGWTVANEGSLTVALDITVTDALRTEGVARELVKRIQNIRKESNFEITDRIVVELTRSEQTDKAVVDFADYISTQVLANEIKTVDHIEDGVEIDFDDYKIYLKVQKV